LGGVATQFGSLLQLVAPMLAGLGLFLCGVHFVSRNLTPLAGRRFRFVLARLVKWPWMAAFVGTFAGLVTQSTNAVTYVIIGLVSGGVIDKRRAILIPTWSHVGTAVLVILVAINFKVAASYLVALAGFAVYFGLERSDRARHVIGTLLGIGFLFLGLEALKEGALPLRDALIEGGVVAGIAASPFALFVFGCALTIICQSSTVVGAIAVAATSIGIFDVAGAAWLVYGSNIGSGLNHMLLARSLRGDAAQIALIQVVQKFAGFAGVLAITGVEMIAGQQFLIPIAAHFDVHASGQVAVIFLAYQIVGSTLCSLFLNQIIGVLERVSPPSPLQEMSKPLYLIDEALVEPTLAVEMAAREERRLLERLPAMLDAVRVDAEGTSPPSAVLRQAGAAISRSISNYVEQILEENPDREDRERIVRLQHRVANLNALFEALDDFVTASQAARRSVPAARVSDQMVESLHSLLSALVDATASEEPEDIHFLIALLGHRDELMEKIRTRVMGEDPNMTAEAQNALFSATMLFERVIWLARRNALLLTRNSDKPLRAQGVLAS
jgi:phosphate:Na+ symporter